MSRDPSPSWSLDQRFSIEVRSKAPRHSTGIKGNNKHGILWYKMCAASLLSNGKPRPLNGFNGRFNIRLTLF